MEDVKGELYPLSNSTPFLGHGITQTKRVIPDDSPRKEQKKEPSKLVFKFYYPYICLVTVQRIIF
jgi:hypothetical protein